MAKDIISIRLDSEWLNAFKRNYPNKSISEITRLLLYRFYPIDSKGIEHKRYSELIDKANELSNKQKRLLLEQEENDLLIKTYEIKKSEKYINKEDII